MYEKEKALNATKVLLASIDQSNVDKDLRVYVKAQFEHFGIWIEGLVLCAKICLYSRWFEQKISDVHYGDLDKLKEWLLELQEYIVRVQTLSNDSSIPHQRVMLFDPKRAMDILREGRFIETVATIRLSH